MSISSEAGPVTHGTFDLRQLISLQIAKLSYQFRLRDRYWILAIEYTRPEEWLGYSDFESRFPVTRGMRDDRDQCTIGINNRNAQQKAGPSLGYVSEVD